MFQSKNIAQRLCGVLVMKRGEVGAVRVIGKHARDNENIVSDTNEPEEYHLVFVLEGQTCGILGCPSYRYITRE